MTSSETKDFVAYEYISVETNIDKEPLYIDCYENFGWELINNSTFVDKDDYFINNVTSSHKKINIKFKRDRKIKNKNKLQTLQRKLELSLNSIEKLEKEPNTISFIYAMSIGLLGTIFLALSVFSFTGNEIYYVPFILCGIIGIIGWILPYFIYKKIKSIKEQENISLIDEQYNIIYDVCEQANKLLN